MAKQGLLRNPTIKFLGSRELSEKNEAVQSSSLFINSIFSLIIVSIIFAFDSQIAGWLKAPSLAPLLILSCVNILLLIPFNHCEILMQAEFKFDTLFRSAFIRQGIFFTGIVLLYLFQPTRFTLLNVLFLQIVALIVALIYLYSNCSRSLLKKFIYDAELSMKFFHFGKFTFGTNLFASLSRSFDHFITAAVLG